MYSCLLFPFFPPRIQTRHEAHGSPIMELPRASSALFASSPFSVLLNGGGKSSTHRQAVATVQCHLPGGVSIAVYVGEW